MKTGYIIVEAGDAARERTPVVRHIVIGRAADCGLAIDDASASRRHVEITAKDGDFVWKDLGSTNGTLFNGKPMLEGRLSHGDALQIGQTVLRFEEEAAEEEEEDSSATIFRQTITDWNQTANLTRAVETGNKAEQFLRTLCSVTNQLSTEYDIAALADRILQTTLTAIDAQRGALLFAGEDGQLFDPPPGCDYFHTIEGGEIKHVGREDLHLSRTVVRRVMVEGDSVFCQDTAREGGIDASASMMAMDLRSILCVPLRGKSGVLGALYMDSDAAGRQYTHDDLLLATAVGNTAGIALENALMHQEILEKQRIEQEIDHAWNIQQGFLVKEWPQEDKRYGVYGDMQPAKTVGGDFYDFVQPGKDLAGVLIGDVSGKGVPAALAMAQILAEFRIRSRALASPAAVLSALNETMAERSQRGMFCTLCYVLFDLKKGVATYANAGHHPVTFLTKGGFEEGGPASGPPAGVLPGSTWQDEKRKLKKGDGVLLFTDGILEARALTTQVNGAGGTDREFGNEGVHAVVSEYKDAPPQDLVEGVINAVRRFCAPAPPHDDCTVIALRYEG